MGTSLWFDICDLLGLQIVVPSRSNVMQRMYASAYEYYQYPKQKRPDQIKLIIGNFEPSFPPGAKTVNKEFVVAPDYLCWQGSHGRGTTEIEGLESRQTVIRHVPYREIDFRCLLPGLRSIGMYVEPILKYHFFRDHDAYLLHGGAVERDGRGVLVFGTNGAHKTRIILELCRNHGFKFLGDDLILIKDGMVCPVIEHERVLRTRYAKLNAKDNPLFSKLAYARTFIPENIPAGRGPEIGAPARIAMTILVDRQLNPNDVLKTQVQKDDIKSQRHLPYQSLWQRVRALERLELSKHQRRHLPLINFGRMLMAYEFGVPGSHIFRHFLLEDHDGPADLGRVPSFEMALPSKYRSSNTTEINELITACLSRTCTE